MIFANLLFSGCDNKDEAQKIIGGKEDFKQLKALSNKTYTLKTNKGKNLIIKIEDNILASKQLEGKAVLLNFWATWCPPCVEEIPILNELYEKYKDKFVIIGILFERNKNSKELEKFIVKHNIKFPIVVGDENFRIARAINNVQKVPESYLYSKNGRFIKSYIGKVQQNALESLIK